MTSWVESVPRRIGFGALLAGMLLLSCLSHDSTALKINKLGIPDPIENGSTPAVIMDCDYNYDTSDTKGLVVQWYYNYNSQPVYQWIPPGTPEALGTLKGRLDLKHKITDDPYTMHRALRILWPTVEIAGNYKCRVSSYVDEDQQNKNLVVYVPASKLEVNYTKPTEHSVNVTCQAEGIYPEPEAAMLFYDEKTNATQVKGAKMMAAKDDGRFNAILYNVFNDSGLAHETLFECIFQIPNASYVIREQIAYYRGPLESTAPHSSTNILISTESSLIVLNAGAMARSSFLYGLAALVSLTISRVLVQFS